MKTYVLLCTAIVSLALPARAFEGTVTSRRISVKKASIAKLVGDDPKKSEKIFDLSAAQLLEKKDEGIEEKVSTVTIRGSKVRIDAGPETYVLMDADTGALQVVNLKERQVMEMTKAEMKAAAEKLKPGSPAMQEQLAKLPPEKRKEVEAMLKKVPQEEAEKNAPKLHPLGKNETINGYKCTAYEARIDGETTIGWITEDTKDVAAAFRSFAAAEHSIRPGPKNVRMLIAEKGLPVRMQTLTASGYQLDEIIKIEPKPIAETLFEIPAGLIKVNAAGMFGAKPQ